MKTRMLLIILVCAAISFAQTIKSGHASANLKCSSCHDCEIPTKQNPCLKACPREKMFTVDVSPSKGPNYITINKSKKSSDLYQPVLFSHKLHAEMSGMSGGCKLCHHYNPPGQVIGCSDCHELERKRADVSKPDLIGAYHRQCMDCHRSYSKGTDCVSCHAKSGTAKELLAQKQKLAAEKSVHPEIKTPNVVEFKTLKAAGKIVTFFHSDHTNLFGLNCENCHRNEACNKCHATEKVLKAAKSVKTKHEICSSCHDTKSNNKCSSCHTSKTVKGFDHKVRTGFDISKFHGKLSCSRCHTEKGKFTGIKGECLSCHGKWTHENFKHEITGLILDESHSGLECADCHQEKNYTNPECKNCHEDKSYPKNLPGKFVKKK